MWLGLAKTILPCGPDTDTDPGSVHLAYWAWTATATTQWVGQLAPMGPISISCFILSISCV